MDRTKPLIRTEDAEEVFCRVCYGSANAGELFSPCKVISYLRMKMKVDSNHQSFNLNSRILSVVDQWNIFTLIALKSGEIQNLWKHIFVVLIVSSSLHHWCCLENYFSLLCRTNSSTWDIITNINCFNHPSRQIQI